MDLGVSNVYRMGSWPIYRLYVINVNMKIKNTRLEIEIEIEI